ncbi:putative inorganic phosphate cotransporter isoform X1 [Episyrphus balteatus]|uniref:putative inorganic phosphate cotransporter isoform X1 n=1 Tax=Episyrphus balteatus TaxID=286459 RepID=UPI0024860F82|nr:putative inorganic phosphate cotransporter isoform X1 [Episyrphus balteatus]
MMIENKGPLIGARHLQTLLLFLAIAVNYATRLNIAVSLVAMTDAKTTNPNFYEFDWTEKQKSYILSSFFWGYTVSQIPGGYAARRFGVKKTILIATFIGALLGLAIPFCVFWGGWQIFSVIRILQGLTQGILFPCVYQHLAKWSPEKERNRLGVLAHSGIECGTIVAMYLTGMVAASDLGWPGISYVFSGIGIVFSLFWLIFAENTPADSKFITAAERSYIISSQASVEDAQRKKKNIPVPWKAILTSVPFISVFIAKVCDTCGFMTMQAQIPSYLHGALKMEITNNAFYSALPYMTMLLCLFIFMISADVVLKKKWASLLVVRKTCNTIAMWGPAALLIGIGLLNETQRTLAITFITLNVGLNAGHVIGNLLNLIDLSPNHSGILMAFANTFVSIIALVSPLVVGMIVHDVNDRSQWQIVFWIAAGLFILGNLQYLFFAQTDTQPWNDEDFMTKGDKEKGEKVTERPSEASLSMKVF